MDLEPVTYAVRGKTFTGYLADGSQGKAVPGILVVHESAGLDENALSRTRMLGEIGFVAFAMDLYGEKTTDLDRLREINRELLADRPLLRERMTAALASLAGQPGVDSSRLGAIGYCIGALAALELARTGAELGCIVGFHAGIGLIGSAPEDNEAIRPKMLILLGADDPVIGPDQRDAFISEMNAAGKDWQMIVYGGVGHSFTNRAIDSYCMTGFNYDEVADRRSWQAMLDLFDETFGLVSA
jgi:dienelactone hydrolase